MAANPITYLEFESFCRLSFIQPTVWETALFMRVDDAVLAVIAAQSSGAPEAASVSDRSAVRGLLSGIRDRMSNK